MKDIDAALGRIRELCTPGALPCVWHTAYYRVVVRDLGRGDLAQDGSHIGPDDTRMEFRALLADDPDLPVCDCHGEEKAAALEALGRPASRHEAIAPGRLNHQPQAGDAP